jgi:hypothetical protein
MHSSLAVCGGGGGGGGGSVWHVCVHVNVRACCALPFGTKPLATQVAHCSLKRTHVNPASRTFFQRRVPWLVLLPRRGWAPGDRAAPVVPSPCGPGACHGQHHPAAPGAGHT